MRNLMLAIALLFCANLYAADCSTTECACMLVTYHDPAAPIGQDIVTDKFSWQEAPQQLNRNLGTLEVLTILISIEDNGSHLCCIVIDNQGSIAPFAGFALNHFGPSGVDRREIHFLLFSQTAEESLVLDVLDADWQVIRNGDISSPHESPPFLFVERGRIRNLLNNSDSRTIPLSANLPLIDEAVLLRSANRLDLLNGC